MRACKDSWLATYLEYTKNQESPTSFHQWVAMAVISTAIGRHIWLDRGYYTIYPNLFVILVAGSAQCRKSVSLKIGINLLTSIEKVPMIFSQKITNEALIQALSEARVDGASAGLVFAPELSTFMGVDATKSGLIPTLTDLYDSPSDWSYRTRGRGVEELKNVTITILAASTKDWLRSSIPADAVGGGFTSRIIFICRERPSKPILFPELSPDIGQLKSNLIGDLNIIREMKGPILISHTARALAEEWYKRELYKTRDPKLEGYFARKHDTMFKVAMILSVSEGEDRVVTDRHIEKALFMLEENEYGLEGLVASVVANPIGGDTEKILDIIKRAGTIKHSELLRKCWRFASADVVSQMVKTLVESKEIKSELEKDNRTLIYTRI